MTVHCRAVRCPLSLAIPRRSDTDFRSLVTLMPTETQEIETLANAEYKWGFVSDIEADSAPPGLDEGTIRFIEHAKKGEAGGEGRTGCCNGV